MMMVAAANVMKVTAQMSVCLDSMMSRASPEPTKRWMQANQQMQVINQKQRPNGLVRRGEKEREKQRTNRREKAGTKTRGDGTGICTMAQGVPYVPCRRIVLHLIRYPLCPGFYETNTQWNLNPSDTQSTAQLITTRTRRRSLLVQSKFLERQSKTRPVLAARQCPRAVDVGSRCRVTRSSPGRASKLRLIRVLVCEQLDSRIGRQRNVRA